MSANASRLQWQRSICGVALLIGLAAFTHPLAGQVTDTLSRERILRVISADEEDRPLGRFTANSAIAFYNALGWQNHSIWLYTDDQRFNTDGKYGPVAKITPSDALDTLTEAGIIAAGDTGVLVGAIQVDTSEDVMASDLPESYRALNLAPGMNCVRFRDSGTGIIAYVYKQSAGPNVCPAPFSVPNGLRVQKVYSAVFPGSRNIPAVGRFHEGTRRERRRPHFGFKCDRAWCLVLPVHEEVDTIPLPHRNLHPKKRTWEVHGWHDVQTLAVLNPAGNPVPGNRRASIIPDTALYRRTMEHDFSQGWVRSAVVHFRGTPGGKYGRRPAGDTMNPYWNFVRGENEIYLKMDSSKPSGWAAEVRNSAGTFEIVVVHRHPHSKPVPGTARFRWMDQDEGGWIRCEDGCCKVAPG